MSNIKEKIITVTVIILTLLTAIRFIAYETESLMADLLPEAHAAEPCYSTNGYTPDEPATCGEYWKDPLEEKITFYAPAGFPCNGVCPIMYKYTTTPEKAADIIFNALNFIRK